MGDEAALLHAIDANPDDDTARLVYADWLDEHGDPERAEFIRVQVEWFRRRERTDETRTLLDRANELLKANARAWTKEVRPLADTGKVKIEFERGFPSRLTLTDPTVNEFATLTWLPTLRWLIVQGRYELTPFVLALIIDLRWLDVLFIWDTEVSAAALEAFERLPPWAVFSFEVVGGDEAALRAFKARRFAQLEQLPPDERRVGAIRSLRFLHDFCPPRPNELVKSLRFDHVTHPFTGDEELCRYAAITELEQLHLDRVSVTTEGLRHLARLPNLTELKIEQCPVDSLEPLAACPGLTDLAVNLYDTDRILGDTGTAGLERLTNLRRLSLVWCDVGRKTVRRLAGLRHLRALELDLWEAEASLGAGELAVLAGLPELEQLALNTWLWATDLQYLEPLRNLQTLALHVLGGSADEFRHLAELTQLRALKLSGKGVTEEGLRKLATLESLRVLELSGTEVTERGARVIALRMPGLTITLDGRAIESATTE